MVCTRSKCATAWHLNRAVAWIQQPAGWQAPAGVLVNMPFVFVRFHVDIDMPRKHVRACQRFLDEVSVYAFIYPAVRVSPAATTTAIPGTCRDVRQRRKVPSAEVLYSVDRHWLGAAGRPCATGLLWPKPNGRRRRGPDPHHVGYSVFSHLSLRARVSSLPRETSWRYAGFGLRVSISF
jgi:hypothetical protein